MRLGLIGTGKQGQRYLQERNGGRHIVVSGSRSIPLDGVDGVIIATHPAGHKALALEALAMGKRVLCEKPLALTLEDCEEIIDAAEALGHGFLEVAHVPLWSRYLQSLSTGEHVAVISYKEHRRDYSAWLDWAPHGLALLADAMPTATEDMLVHSLCVYKGEERRMRLMSLARGDCYDTLTQPIEEDPTPMFLMVRDFCIGDATPYDFQRRVYRALFAQENHGTT